MDFRCLCDVDTGARTMTASQHHLQQLALAAPCQTAAMLSALLVTQQELCAENNYGRKGG